MLRRNSTQNTEVSPKPEGREAYTVTSPSNPISFSEKLNRIYNPVSRWMMYISAAVLFIWTGYTFLDVLLRYIFNRPLPFAIDITSMVLALLAFFALGYTQMEKRHIYIDLLTAKLKPKSELALSMSMMLFCTATSGILLWQSIANSQHFGELNILTMGGLPLFPATLMVPIGALFLLLVFLRDLYFKILDGIKLQLPGFTWVLAFGLPVLFIVLMLLGMYQVFTPISTSAAGAISVLLLFIVIFLGMPVAFALLMVTILVMGYSAGANNGFMILGQTLFNQVTAYNWCVVPLYILMSYFIMAGGLGTAAFFGAYKWIGHWRGGLGLATVAGSTALAAVVGTGTAATVTMGLVALPEMRKYRYSDALSTGVVAAGATLGPIIPPSLPFIVYGIMTSESIGQLFIAGLVPGLVLALAFALYVMVVCRINPNLGPAAARASWSERFKAIPVFGPIVFLFLFVIGGIYAGIFTAIEGGATGSIMALIIALFGRSVTWPKFVDALAQTMKFVGMILLLVTGSLLYSNALGASGLSASIASFVNGLGISPMILVILILLAYMIFGIVADTPVILMLTIPILAPMLRAMGIDLIWFGVVASIVAGLGSISPPYAMGIFMLRAIACPDVSLSTMYKGIVPFCIVTIVVVVLCLVFPNIVMGLPHLMYK